MNNKYEKIYEMSAIRATTNNKYTDVAKLKGRLIDRMMICSDECRR